MLEKFDRGGMFFHTKAHYISEDFLKHNHKYITLSFLLNLAVNLNVEAVE